MKPGCFLGHKWRKVEWFKPRPGTDPHWWRPDEMCMRCFKEKRYAVLRVTSAEGPGLWYHLGPQYEGQPAPAEYGTWDEYWRRMKTARQEILRKAR